MPRPRGERWRLVRHGPVGDEVVHHIGFIPCWFVRLGVDDNRSGFEMREVEIYKLCHGCQAYTKFEQLALIPCEMLRSRQIFSMGANKSVVTTLQ